MRLCTLLISAIVLVVSVARGQMPDGRALPVSIEVQVVSTKKVREETHEVIHFIAGDRVVMSQDLWFTTDRSTPTRRAYRVFDPTIPVKKPGEPCEPENPLLVVYQGYMPLRYGSVSQHFIPAGCQLTTSEADEASDKEYRLTRGESVLLSLTCTPEGELRARTQAKFSQHLKHRQEMLSGNMKAKQGAVLKSGGSSVSD